MRLDLGGDLADYHHPRLGQRRHDPAQASDDGIHKYRGFCNDVVFSGARGGVIGGLRLCGPSLLPSSLTDT